MPKEPIRDQFNDVAAELDYGDEDKIAALFRFIEEQGLDEPFMDFCDKLLDEGEAEDEES